MKKIIFISKYALCPDSNQNSRLFDKSKIFNKKKFNVEIITSESCFYDYNLKNYKESFLYYSRNYKEIKHILIKGPKINSGFSILRIYTWLIFELKLFLILINKKFDFLYISSLPLTTVINGYIFKKLFKKPFILEIRDIWPQSLIEISNYKKNNLFIKILYWIENIGYKNAKYIVSPLENFDKYLKIKIKKFIFFHVPMDLPRLGIKPKFNYLKKNSKFRICYAGSFGEANGLKKFIDIIYASKLDNIEFTFIGKGNQFLFLKKKYSSKNIIFKNYMPIIKLISFLENYDLGIHIIPDRNIYNYGISPNKWGTYILSGLPILTISKLEETYLTKNKIGFNINYNKKDIIDFFNKKCNVKNRKKYSKIAKKAYSLTSNDLDLQKNLNTLINKI
tara:strand:+ start:3754 stop:4932 length:1179 start_codon:yes stop_codon:yes gene_type:complete